MKKFKREWVWKAATIFLIVLVLLTFFSNTIMNFSLPEVVTAQPMAGTITNAVRGTANAAAAGSYSVEVEFSSLILMVYVRDGDEVQRGDRLFLLEAGENELMEQLNAARLRYQHMLLDMTEGNYAMQNEMIRQAREDLDLARADRAALGTANMTEAQAQAQLDQAAANLNTQSGRLAALEAELGFIDDLDARSARIGQFVIAYDQALASFVVNVGMSYDQFVEENPGVSNQWTQAVENARSVLQREAATARAAVVAEIGPQQGLVSAAEAARTAAQNMLDRVQRIAAADELVRTRERALNTALITLANEQQQGSATHAGQLLDLQALADEIADLEARIERQGGEAEDGELAIVAVHAGTVSGLTAIAGQRAEPGMPLARIEVADMGYVAEIAVDARQAQEIRPGTAVEVTALAWFANVTGRVNNVRVNPDDPTNSRLVSVELAGDVTVGEQLSLSIPISHAQYQTIVPRSAIGQDTTGDHIYVVQSTDSLLGTRYTAVRVGVSIEAYDETRAAVRAIDGNLDQRVANVIVRSSAPLSDRDRVRLANE